MSDRREPPVSFRPGGLSASLDARGERNEVARRDLARYYATLQRELSTLHLSEREASLIVDALNGCAVDETTAPLLWANVDDAIMRDGLDEKWGLTVRRPDGLPDAEKAGLLVMRLRELRPGQCMALLDAVERFWRDPNPLHDALVRVGLIQPALPRHDVYAPQAAAGMRVALSDADDAEHDPHWQVGDMAVLRADSSGSLTQFGKVVGVTSTTLTLALADSSDSIEVRRDDPRLEHHVVRY
jgi:hypothetical protein